MAIEYCGTKDKPYEWVLCKKWKDIFITLEFVTFVTEIIKIYSVCLFINCLSVISFLAIVSTHFPSKDLHKNLKCVV